MAYIRLTDCNGIIDIIEYEKLNVRGNPPNTNALIEKGTGILNAQNYLARKRIRRKKVMNYANMNFNQNNSKFLTITTHENISDVVRMNKEFKQFIQRLKVIDPYIQYLAVIEFQKRGAIHYHILINMKYIPQKQLLKVWGLGSVHINAIKKVDNLGAYLVKYMNKDTDDIRLKGFKGYNCSKGLKEPNELKSWINGDLDKIIKITQELNKHKKMPVYSTKYTSEHLGDIAFTQYNLNRINKKEQ